MEHSQSKGGPYAALLTVQLLFGSLPVIAKVVLAVVPAVALVGFRVGITALTLFLVQLARKRIYLQKRSDYVKIAVLSLFGITFNQLFFIKGLSLTKASNTSLLAVTIPVFALAVSTVTGSEKIGLRKIVGIILAGIGVLIIIDPFNASFSSTTTLGDIMIIINSLSFAIYVSTSKSLVTRNGAFRSIMWLFIFASVICVPFGIWSFETAADPAPIPAGIWLLILHIALFATAAPYLLNAWALARVNPSTLAVFIYLQPLIGFLFAVFFLGEHIGLSFIFATVLIFAGVFAVSRSTPSIETTSAA